MNFYHFKLKELFLSVLTDIDLNRLLTDIDLNEMLKLGHVTEKSLTLYSTGSKTSLFVVYPP